MSKYTKKSENSEIIPSNTSSVRPLSPLAIGQVNESRANWVSNPLDCSTKLDTQLAVHQVGNIERPKRLRRCGPLYQERLLMKRGSQNAFLLCKKKLRLVKI